MYNTLIYSIKKNMVKLVIQCDIISGWTGGTFSQMWIWIAFYTWPTLKTSWQTHSRVYLQLAPFLIQVKYSDIDLILLKKNYVCFQCGYEALWGDEVGMIEMLISFQLTKTKKQKQKKPQNQQTLKVFLFTLGDNSPNSLISLPSVLVTQLMLYASSVKSYEHQSARRLPL